RTCFQEAKSQQQMALALAPADVDCRLLLCAHYLSVADVLAALKDHSQAVKETIEVLPLAPPQWPQYPVAAAILARSVRLALDGEKLDEKRQKAMASQYGDRVVELMRKAMATGFQDAEAVRKAPEFEAVRDRDDFKKLLEEMGKKATR